MKEHNLKMVGTSKTYDDLCVGLDVMDFKNFESLLTSKKKAVIHSKVNSTLVESRKFIDYLLNNNLKVYGLTTGFADLRDKQISSSEASQLSKNILTSHDAGIGEPLPYDVVKGAMILCAHSLAKGHSGITSQALSTLLQMINHNIVPVIPCTGSLGASGDLAFLARLGRAMTGENVAVNYDGQIIMAHEALNSLKISPFNPKAKEGLALTNGTSFMTSMLIKTFETQIRIVENGFILIAQFLSAVKATDVAFYESLHNIRPHAGQKFTASVLSNYLKNSPFMDMQSTQDDYSLRCLPQIMGPLLDTIRNVKEVLLNEMSSVTDNPLIFRQEEISKDIPEHKRHHFNGKSWVVISGGNFHGEYLANAADRIAMANSKFAYTLERQITYMLNPARNKNRLPIYLIAIENKIGLESGCMITQYTANALTQKIAYLGNPVSTYNITSANEAEDIVSYGATAVQKLLQQQSILKELLTIYLVVVAQAYSIQREKVLRTNHSELFSEIIFKKIQGYYADNSFPMQEETSFDEKYRIAQVILEGHSLIEETDQPFRKFVMGE